MYERRTLNPDPQEKRSECTEDKNHRKRTQGLYAALICSGRRVSRWHRCGPEPMIGEGSLDSETILHSESKSTNPTYFGP